MPTNINKNLIKNRAICLFILIFVLEISFVVGESEINRNVEIDLKIIHKYYRPFEGSEDVLAIESAEVVKITELPWNNMNYFNSDEIGSFFIKIYNNNNEEIGRSPLDLSLPYEYVTVPDLISVFATFPSNGDERRIEIYFERDNIGEYVLNIPRCNSNGICEAELNENYAYCSSDCAATDSDRYCTSIDPDGVCDPDCVGFDIDCENVNSCSNMHMDFQEEGIDCGGNCQLCSEGDIIKTLEHYDRNWISIGDVQTILSNVFGMISY